MKKKRCIDLSKSHKIILVEKDNGGIWWIEHEEEEEFYALVSFAMVKNFFLQGDEYVSEKFEDYLYLFTEDLIDLSNLDIDESKWHEIEKNLNKMQKKDKKDKNLNSKIKLDTNKDKIELELQKHIK